MATQTPIPLIAPRSTDRRLDHCDETAYSATPDTILYKFVDAICGTTGAGALVNQLLLARLNGALETIYYNDLDYIFGSVHFLARSPAESYSYNPMIEMLTAEQWNEVRIKDSWYRDRIRNFFIACGLGGTPQGLRTAVLAAVGVDATLFEVWRALDNFGLVGDIGRAPSSARNEVVIKPHKESLSPGELRLVRDMLDKIAPLDCIVTVNTTGMAVDTPVSIAAACADSTYYEVQKEVLATPLLSQLPPPELLSIDLLPGEDWLYLAQQDPQLAPYTAFNITAETGYYYLIGDDKRSPIDACTYGTLRSDGSVQTEPNFEVFTTDEEFTDWMTYEQADSPDNFPGGKYGIHPSYAPAINPDRSPYKFPWVSQAAYVTQRSQEVIQQGGDADQYRYRLPLRASSQSSRVFWPEYAIAAMPPARDSTVSSSLTASRYPTGRYEQRDPAVFVR